MEVRHYYYTSYANTRSGKAGFQIKAMSPGISREQQALLARLVNYRIPPALDARAVETHPVSLRYHYSGPQECQLLSIHSTGSDEYGRPGNFFAHALVLEANAFSSMAPIFAWKSTFWRGSDQEERDDIVSLPVFSSLGIEPALAMYDLWNFLSHENRRELLYKLLCAVIHSEKTQRRIVILDSDERVACWIAAVSCLLPPGHRPLLTFATYHHDPSQARYLITGTAGDSAFLFSPTSEQNSFVLNPETGASSEVEPSAYAQLAVQAAQPEIYERVLQPLFDLYARRFPAPLAAGSHLDDIALYAGVLAPGYQPPLTTGEGAAIALVLPSFARIPEYTSEERRELMRIEDVLRISLFSPKISLYPLILNLYHNLLEKLNMLQISIEPMIVEALIICTERLVTCQEFTTSTACIDTLYQIYGEARVTAARSSHRYLRWLAERMEKMTQEQLLLTWQWMGRALRPGSDSLEPTLASLRVAHQLFQRGEIQQMDALLRAVTAAIQEQALNWLQLLVERHNELPVDVFPDMLAFLYCQMVTTLSLAERQPYRAVILPVCAGVLEYEIQEDVLAVPPEQRIAALEQWASYARSEQLSGVRLLKAGLRALHRQCETPREWQVYALAILNSEQCDPLPLSIEEALVAVVCASPSLTPATPEEFAVYIKYRHYPSLTDEARAAIEGLLALTCGQIRGEQARYLRRAVDCLSLEAYRAVIEHHIPRFFGHTLSQESHRHLVQALFPRGVELEATAHFWQVYLETLITLLTHPETALKAVEMLDFWFSARPWFFPSDYPIQEFFLSLSGCKLLWHRRQARKALSLLTALASSRDWYAALLPFFPEEQHLVTASGQLASLLRKFYTRMKSCAYDTFIYSNIQYIHIKAWMINSSFAPAHEQRASSAAGLTSPARGNQGARGEAPAERALEDEISELFRGQDVTNQHRSCARLYRALSPGCFWSLYWRYFSRLLVSSDAERIVAVLDYWFDHSYEVLDTARFLPQEFFLGVHRALEAQADASWFRETARVVEKRINQDGTETHPWRSIMARSFGW